MDHFTDARTILSWVRDLCHILSNPRSTRTDTLTRQNVATRLKIEKQYLLSLARDMYVTS